MPSRARRTRSRDRGGDADQLGDLVQTDEAADVVGRLDVDIERDVHRCTDCGDLGEAQIGREVDRARAETLQDPRGGGVRRRQHHRHLGLHLLGEQAYSSRVRERGEDADVRDQDAAKAVSCGSTRVVESGDDLLLAPCGRRENAAGRGARRRRRVPGGVRSSEERDLDRCGGRRSGQLVQLGVGLEEHAASLRDAMHGHVEPFRLLENRLEAARPLRARDLHAVLRPVGEALLRVGELVEVAARQSDRAQEVARLVHAPRAY